jgi:amphi-Trp domain-containing protein
MGDTSKIESAMTLEASKAADYLSKVADGFRQGRVTVTQGKQIVHLEPGQFVRMEIEAESKPKKSKGSLQLEISWKAGTEADEEDAEPLEITAAARTEAASSDS